MENKVNWNNTMSNLPTIIKGIGSIILTILKLPNFIWKLPFLGKLRGIRMTLLTVLGSIHAILLTVNIDVVSGTICKIIELFNYECDTSVIVSVFNKVMLFIITALAIEDQQSK